MAKDSEDFGFDVGVADKGGKDTTAVAVAVAVTVAVAVAVISIVSDAAACEFPSASSGFKLLRALLLPSALLLSALLLSVLLLLLPLLLLSAQLLLLSHVDLCSMLVSLCSNLTLLLAATSTDSASAAFRLALSFLGSAFSVGPPIELSEASLMDVTDPVVVRSAAVVVAVFLIRSESFTEDLTVTSGGVVETVAAAAGGVGVDDAKVFPDNSSNPRPSTLLN